MALQAYPDVPLFRYPYTQLTEAQIAQKLAPAAQGGPGSKGGLERDLAGTTLRIVTDGAGTLTWQFGQDDGVTFDNATGGYGALTLDHVTLIAHLVPGTTKGYAIAWDRHNNLATVFELWWGGGPAPQAREINRAVWHGYIDTGSGAPDRRSRQQDTHGDDQYRRHGHEPSYHDGPLPHGSGPTAPVSLAQPSDKVEQTVHIAAWHRGRPCPML